MANQERVFESRDHHNTKSMFISRDCQPIKISPILHTWFLYSLNTYKFEMATTLDFGIISNQETIG